MQRYETTDVEESVEIASRLFYSHRLTPARARTNFAFELSGFQVGSVSIGRLAYGCEVNVAMDIHDDVYGVSAPKAGRLIRRTGTTEVVSTPDVAQIAGPVDDAVVSGFENPADHLTMVRFDRRTLECELGRIINHEVTAPIDFEPILDLRRGRGAQWWQMVHVLYDSARDADGLATSPILSAQLASAMMSGLLLASDHRYRPLLERDASRVVPASIRRAVDFIQDNADSPITIPDVAAAIGVSVRTLQHGFNRHLDTTPLTYLARVRLDRAHRDLAMGTPEVTSVTAIATRWGFYNPGRFANRYPAAYGVLPVDTLRRS